MAALVCKGCGYPLRPLLDGFVIDLAHDRFDELRHELYGVPRLDGRFYCPPDPYAFKVTGHVPSISALAAFAETDLSRFYDSLRRAGEEGRAAESTPDNRSETSLVSNYQLTAEQWRVISYLHHPDQLSRRTSPSLAVVIRKQAVDRADVVEVVERGLVEARVGGEECSRGPLLRLPEKAIRLRLTKAGTYRASHDPQHLVLCGLRFQPLSVFTLLRGLAQPVHFSELCDMADRGLFDTFWIDTDTVVPMADLRACESFAQARITKRGRTFVAYA